MEDLTTIPSDFTVRETIDRLASAVTSKGMTVFARINHGDNAAQQGLELRPTELIIFGNPKAGTILMQDKQISGIDLPVKALAWEDEQGAVWLTYNNTDWIANRHQLTGKSEVVLHAIGEGMALIAGAATKR